MINGGYFYNGRHTGISVVDGETAGTIPAVRGSLPHVRYRGVRYDV